jgi:PAS domain S-box-containing protein
MNAVVSFSKRDGSIESGLFRAALDVCPESLAIIEGGRILFANFAFADTFGYGSQQELQEKPLAELLPLDHPCSRAAREGRDSFAAFDCTEPACEFHLVSRGAPTSIQASCSRFRTEGRNLLLVTARDVNRQERRRVLRDSEKRYRAIFDAAAIGILQCAIDGRVMESNPALQQLLGYTREELRGMHFRDFTHADDFAADSVLFQQMVEGKRNHYQMELRYVGKRDLSGWVRLTASVVSGLDGRPASVIGMVEDITESKRTERQLREAQKMEVIGRLVGGVAHDFNNLLTGIMLYCDLLRDGLDSGSRLRHHAEEVRLAAQHGAALVQQLLSVARQQPADPRVLSINESVAAMRNLLRRLIGENIRLDTRLAHDLWAVKMDPAQLQQIILNLVLNARDAMPDGGRIRIETCNAKSHGSDSAVEFIVSDNGCGIAPEVRAHLFEPFFTTKGPGQGNGLGLSTVHNIVHRCGGSITVDSELGHGTRVTVRLPRAQAESAKQGIAEKNVIPERGGETILLVEDNSAVRRSALRILRASGYKVLAASNGPQALKLCRHPKPIDLLLVDLVMPGFDGRQVARELRACRPNLQVLYTSGYEHPQVDEALEPVVLFRKPFTSDALLIKVREVLNQVPPSNVRKGNQP